MQQSFLELLQIQDLIFEFLLREFPIFLEILEEQRNFLLRKLIEKVLQK